MDMILLFLAVAGGAWLLITVLSRSPPTPEGLQAAAIPRAATPSAPATPKTLTHLPGGGDYETEVVGESHYQDALAAICGGKTSEGHELECVATLTPEPTNPHDRNAVAVVIQGRTVGHLARELAPSVGRLLREHGLRSIGCDALIVGGWNTARGEGSFGVKLDLVDEDEWED